MTLAITHAAVATIADDPDAEINKDEWNAAHSLSMATAKLIGRTTAGTGAPEEIAVGSGLSLSAGTLTATGGGIGLALATGTDAATTCAANTLYVADMSAWATADRNYTMPAAPTVGDRVGILAQAGSPSFELIIKGNTSQTINGGSAASEWSRVFITGEYVELLYVASNAWIVVIDKRIPQKGMMRLGTSATTETAATFTQPTAKGGVWVADTNVGSICTIGSDKITARRAGNYAVTANGLTDVDPATSLFFAVALWKNGVSTLLKINLLPVSSGHAGVTGLAADNVPLAVDDFLVYTFYSQAGNDGLKGSASPRLDSNFAMTEVL